MKRSIRKRITIIIMGLVAGTVLLCLLINSTLLEKFYYINKQNSIMEGFESINTASLNYGIQAEEFQVVFDSISANDNIMMIIIDAEGNALSSSVNDVEMLQKSVWEHLSGTQKDVQIIENHEDYILQKLKNPRLNSDYFMLFGTLDNGNLIIMQTPIESIKESVSISSRFLAYVGWFAIIISGIIIWYVTKKITNPILELSKISEKMTRLDFEAKYTSGGEDELGLLGTHMNQLSATLQRTISELKAANNQLQKDIEQKNQVDQMRKEFVSNVSHELKTPLAIIQGYSEGLKECLHDDAENREFYCAVIMDEADKMNRMVKELLSLNQIEFGNQVISFERFDIISVIAGVLQSTAILLKQEEIKLSFLNEDPIYVWADEFKVEQVITNYLSNALHHVNDEKKIEIQVFENNGRVRICIFNTGNQIPQEDLEKIWMKFYKVDKARTREYGGSGIGLSIVKAIMDSFHKECGVRNCENGVEFWFELDANTKETCLENEEKI